MTHLTSPSPIPRPEIADLVATLEAMREAGWITTTLSPEPGPVVGIGPRDTVIGESR
ncbi:hypothetical protein NN3_07480 [Nocardia neocaledoniensis NBRC 108232]|uniref:Uncharacterized protein n=1 Tax=Nocardia neocaledoniensis TaxID=236511 RepID=A0A317NEF6_9NOCA|nr:hypothetical protein DFR69_107387 [Nocardia neocaledoniensis]GEM29741.1 hypothetical protein NN3_07480 [Nocardia neocaledoniensis NBRC 108232]